MGKSKFTTKQQRFIDFYDGNATDAARKAGYLQAERSGLQNVGNYRILAEIKKREQQRNKSTIASREERQAFWTESMRNPEIDINARHKASELLGRSEADFTDNQRLSDPGGKALIWRVEIIDPHVEQKRIEE